MYQQITSIDGNSQSGQSLLSRNKFGMRQQRSFKANATDARRLESSNALVMKGLKKSGKMPAGKEMSLQTTAHTKDETTPHSDNETSRTEDGEKLLATWLSLNAKKMNTSYPNVKKVNGFSKSSFNSLNTSDGISNENPSKIAPFATDPRDVPQASSGTSIQKNKAREIISSPDANVDADDMGWCLNDQSTFTSNVSESVSKIRAAKEDCK